MQLNMLILEVNKLLSTGPDRNQEKLQPENCAGAFMFKAFVGHSKDPDSQEVIPLGASDL
jgi:hypothetical protein